jgi:hypothetical protein
MRGVPRLRARFPGRFRSVVFSLGVDRDDAFIDGVIVRCSCIEAVIWAQAAARVRAMRV